MAYAYTSEEGGEVRIILSADYQGLERDLAEAESLVDDYGNIWEKTGTQVQKSAEGMTEEVTTFVKTGNEKLAQMSESLADMMDKWDGVGSIISSIGSSLKSIGFGALTVGATAATKSLASMAKAGVADTSALEDIQIQMIGLTHSVEAGNKAMSMAVQYYKNNPFNRFEVTDATKSLVQFGAELNNIPNLLDNLGKVSLSTGAKIDTLAYFYQRMISDGKINTLDLMTLANQNVPIWSALAEQLNTTSGGVRELAASGKISIEDFKKAFDTLADDDAMERFNKTFSRQVDRLKGRLSDMRGAIAGYYTTEEEGLVILENGLYSAVTKLAKRFADVMTSTGSSANPVGQSVIEGFQKLGVALGKIVDQVTKLVEPALNLLGKALNFLGDNSALLVPLLGLLATKLTGFASQLPVIGKFLTPIVEKVGELTGGIKALVHQHPLLSALIALFATGLVEAYKNDEKFRQTIKDLVGAMQEFASSLMEVVREILPTLMSAFQTIAQSGVVQVILQTVASALKGIAQALANIPTSILSGLISFFLSLKLLNTNPIFYAIYAISLLVAYVKEMGGLTEVLKKLPEQLLAIGHNMMTGFLNGVIEGSKKVWSWIKDFGNSVVGAFKNIFQIHSPSKAMEHIGKYITLGLAEGISNNEDAVQVALNNLASDILSLSNKVIKNKVDFGILDIKQEYQEWQKVSKLFTQGSEQYNTAIEKMEDARKSANLKILQLQNDYNNALDSTIDKIANFYGLFSDVSTSAGKNASKILTDLDKQVATTEEWVEAQRMIKNLGLDEALVAELSEMGVDSVYELQAVANMTSDELSRLNEMWLKKQFLANEAGVEQMATLKNDTLNEIEALKDGIDGITIDVSDVGGKLVSNIAEGVYGAMPTLESAFSQLDDYIAKAQRSLSGSSTSTDVSSVNDFSLDTATSKDELLKGVEGSISNLSDSLLQMVIGSLGALLAVKIAPKVIKWLFNFAGNKLLNTGTIGQGIAGSLFKSSELGLGLRDGLLQVVDDIPREDTTVSGKILNKIQNWLTPKEAVEEVAKAGKTSEKVAKAVQNTQKQTQTIATSTQSIGQSASTASTAFSKVNSFFGTAMKGAGAVILIAGAIAAVAGAIHVAYKALKDVDFKEFQLDLVMMTEAVVAMGALAWAAGKLQIGWKGVLALAGIAADIALVAKACKSAYDDMAFTNWDTFQAVLGHMAEAVAVFSIFVGVYGAIMSSGVGALAVGGGILAIAGIAGDIAVVAKACRSAYDDMKGVNWSTFQDVLGHMCGAIGAFSGLSVISGLAFLFGGALGELGMLGLCADIAELSKALKVAYDNMSGMDWDEFQAVLGHMCEAIGAFSGLNIILGVTSLLQGLAWASVMAICDELVKVSEALKKVQNNVPDDFKSVEAKVRNIKKTLEIMNGMDLGTVIGAIVTSWSVEPLEKIATMYAYVGEQLEKISNLKINDKTVGDNLSSIEGAIERVRSQTDVITAKLQSWADEAEADSVESAGRVLKVYADVVDNVNKIADYKVKEGTYTAIDAIAGVVNYIRGSGMTMFTLFNSTGNFDGELEHIKGIVEKFVDILPTVEQISKSGVQSWGKTAVKNIEQIEKIVWQIGESGTGGWISNKEEDVHRIQSLLNTFTELDPVAYQISQSGVQSWGENAIKNIEKIEEIILKVGSVDTGGWVEQKENDVRLIQSMMNKYTELAKTSEIVGQMVVDDNAIANIDKINDLIKKVGSAVNQNTRWADKEWSVGMALSMAHKMVELQEVVSQLREDDYSKGLEAVKATIESIFQNIETSLNEYLPEVEQLGANLGNYIVKGLESSQMAIAQAGRGIQSALWSAIEEKIPDEYQQGAWLAKQFSEGVKSVSMDAVGQAIQSAIWWGIQNRMTDEYYQGQALGRQFRQGVYDVDYANSGWWAVQGFINGVNNRGYYSGGDSVYWVGYNIANTFLNGLKKRADEGSPWKTTYESGAWAVEGLIEGIKASEDALVNEAESLADQVVEALAMDDLTMNPSLEVGSRIAPSVLDENYGTLETGRGVVINQENYNYTQYDLERVNDDLAWQLSIV